MPMLPKRKPFRRSMGLSQLEWAILFVLVGAFALLPIYVIRKFWSHATVGTPLMPASDTIALRIVDSLFPGDGTGSVYVDDYQTRWVPGDVNLTQLEQVPTPKAFHTCATSVSSCVQILCNNGFVHRVQASEKQARIFLYRFPPLQAAWGPFEICKDGQKGATWAGSSASAAPDRGACVVYSFSLSEAPVNLARMPYENAAVEADCEVHYFNPRRVPALDAIPDGGRVTASGRSDADGEAATGGMTIHKLTLDPHESYDPSNWGLDERHPATLREEQLWKRERLTDIISSLSHGVITAVKLDLDGRELQVMHSCMRDKSCAALINQWHVTWNLQNHETPGHDPDTILLHEWAQTLSSIYTAGYSQVAVSVVPNSGRVAIGSPHDLGTLQRPHLAGVLGIRGKMATNLPCCYYASYVRRSVDDVVRINSDGQFKSAKEFSDFRKAQFCAESDVLAKQAYGKDASVSSARCPALSKPASADAGSQQ